MWAETRRRRCWASRAGEEGEEGEREARMAVDEGKGGAQCMRGSAAGKSQETRGAVQHSTARRGQSSARVLWSSARPA